VCFLHFRLWEAGSTWGLPEFWGHTPPCPLYSIDMPMSIFVAVLCWLFQGKIYVFDHVFKANSAQEAVYAITAKPIVKGDILNFYITYTVYTLWAEKTPKCILIYSLQNLTNCDKIGYILSLVNLSYRNVNVFCLTWVVSLPYLVTLSIHILHVNSS